MFIHFVLFWMNRDASASARQQLIDDAKAYLGKIPTVRALYTGRPNMTPRPVVDNTYDVGLCVILDDAEGHDVYQAHELHKQFIERNKDKWQRVLIYDFRH